MTPKEIAETPVYHVPLGEEVQLLRKDTHDLRLRYAKGLGHVKMIEKILNATPESSLKTQMLDSLLDLTLILRGRA